MEFFFNELSIKEKRFEKNCLHSLFDVIKKSNTYKIRTCRISLDDYRLLLDSVREDFGKNNIDLFVSFFKPPYESEEVEKHQDEYLLHKWKYKGKDCFGLVFSYILDTLSISYDKDEKYKSSYLEITCDDEIRKVRNASNTDNFDSHIDFLGFYKPVELTTTEIAPDKKKIKLADDHHGKDKLRELANRLVNSPYVVSIINSEENSSYDRRFIRKIFPDGKIRIVLPWTDKGFSMIIQTTGRNMRETEKIARILEERYGKV